MQFVDQVINSKILIGVFIIRILQSAGYWESIVAFDMTSVHILEESESIMSGWSALWDVIFLELKSWLSCGCIEVIMMDAVHYRMSWCDRCQIISRGLFPTSTLFYLLRHAVAYPMCNWGHWLFNSKFIS